MRVMEAVRDADPTLPPAGRRARTTRGAVLRAGVVVAAFVGVAAAPETVWAMGAVACWNLAIVLGRWTSRLLAASGSMALVLAVVVLAVRPPVDWDFPARSVVASIWTALAVASVVLELLLPGRDVTPRPPRSAPLRHSVPLALPWLLAGGWAVAVSVVQGAAKIGWAMNRDQANNLMFARFIIEDGRVDPSRQSNPAFLAQALFAIPFSDGREPVPSHLLLASMATWVGCLLVGATLMVLLVLRTSTSRFAPWLAAGVGLVPFTWFVAGQSFTFGFLNVSLVLVLLLVSLLVASDADAGPWEAAAVQGVLATLMLATWAPLVVVPLALAALRLSSCTRPRTATGLGPPLLAVASLVQVCAYAVVVVLGDVGSDGGNLTANGWIFPVSPLTGLLLWSWTVGLALWRLRAARAMNWTGSTCLLERAALGCMAAMAVAVLLFVGLNAVSNVPLWTYYPQKLSWVMSIICVALLVCLTGPPPEDARSGRTRTSARGGPGSLRAVAKTSVAIALTVGVLASVAPSLQGPGWSGVLPVLRMVDGGDYDGAETAAESAVYMANRTEPRLVWLYGSPVQDNLINRWLVAQHATSVSDPIRSFGEVFLPTPADVCRAIHRLGPGVVVHTNADNVAAALQAECGSTEDFEVVRGTVP